MKKLWECHVEKKTGWLKWKKTLELFVITQHTYQTQRQILILIWHPLNKNGRKSVMVVWTSKKKVTRSTITRVGCMIFSFGTRFYKTRFLNIIEFLKQMKYIKNKNFGISFLKRI